MKQLRWSQFAVGLCLLALATMAAQCSEEEQLAGQLAANAAAETAMALELTLFPEETATPTLTPKPEPTEFSFTDELDDVRSLMSGELTDGWGPGLDIGGVVISLDPATGDVVFKLSLPGVEDFDAFIQSNPNWGFIIAGDGDPEGTPAVPGLEMFGMGQWHIGCFAYTGELTCELFDRGGNQFQQRGESFGGAWVFGEWVSVFPEDVPRAGDRLGFAVVDPFYFDTLGLENWVPQLEIDIVPVDDDMP